MLATQRTLGGTKWSIAKSGGQRSPEIDPANERETPGGCRHRHRNNQCRFLESKHRLTARIIRTQKRNRIPSTTGAEKPRTPDAGSREHLAKKL